MRNSNNEPLKEGPENGLESIRGFIERMHALKHPEWPDKKDDLDSLKTAITQCTSELERFKYRNEARGAELEKLKAQYAELERLYRMRPDAMRRAGEMEITELVRKKQDLAEQEKALLKAKADLENERAAQAREAKARLEKIGLEYSERAKKLEEAERRNAARENALSGSETRLEAKLEAARRRAAEEAMAGFSSELAAREAGFAREKALLTAEAENWRRKAEEAYSHSAAAGEEAAQSARQARLETDACRKRSAELDRQLEELEQLRARVAEREEACRRLEEETARTAQDLKERAASLEKDYADKKKDLEAVKARMRIEIDELTRQYHGK